MKLEAIITKLLELKLAAEATDDRITECNQAEFVELEITTVASETNITKMSNVI